MTIWVQVNFYDPQNPPTLVDRDGNQWTWHDHLISDGNSVPKLLRGIFPTDYCEPAPFLHDEAYNTKTLLYRAKGETAWVQVNVTREQADDLIYQGWRAAGGQVDRCKLAWCTLRTFGWWDYGK